MAFRPPVWPRGLVTFVFSDIEGSTRLFRRVGDRYPTLLERHTELLGAAWRAHGGHQVDAEGDSMLVAFADAGDALRACAAAQRAIEGEPWPTDARIRVRIGVHTGLAEPREGKYVALAVHQAARVVAAANGGQVVVSGLTASAAGSPRSLTDLGLFRIRDFDNPLRLFQLADRGLPDRFPAPRALPAEGHNLARPATRFVGRGAEVALIVAELEAERLLSLVGPGGVGKTRLATEIGLTTAPTWADGVWMVDLAAIDRAELIVDALADAVGVAAVPDCDRWHDVLEALAGRRALLLLDNCERRTDEIAGRVEQLLAACPAVSVLATSREPLHLPGEVVWRLDPLPLPDADTPAAVADADATRLFAERARAVNRRFEVDAANAPIVAGICRALDGLPLAIEIAAARVGVLGPREILAGLEDRFRLLRSNDRTLPDRQRTLRALLDWSDQLLSPPERTALHRLTVFAAGFSLDAAVAAIGATLTSDDAADLVFSLVDKSLVVVDPTADETRYRLLETVRAYAGDNLDADVEGPAAVAGLAAWFSERIGPEQVADRRWVGETGANLETLRGLVPRLAPVDAEGAQRLALTVARYHAAVQLPRAGIAHVAPWARTLPAPTPTRVALLSTLADLHRWCGEIDAAGAVLIEAQAVADAVGVPTWDDVCVVKARGEVAIRRGRPAEAVETALDALRGPLSPRGRARICNLLAISRVALGDLAGAAEAAHDELAACLVLGDEHYLAGAHANVAEVALRRGRPQLAARHQLSSLELAGALGQLAIVAFSLIIAARLASDPEVAVRLQARADRTLDETGLTLYADDRRLSDELLDLARRRLGPEAFAEHRAGGHQWSLPEAIGTARALLAEVAGARTPAPMT